MRLRYLLILFTLLTAACTSPALKELPPAYPVSAFGEVHRIAVGAIAPSAAVKAGKIGNFHGGGANIPYSSYGGKRLDGLDGKFRVMAYEELQNNGYPVQGEKHNMLVQRDIKTPPSAAFVIAGTIQQVRYDTYSSLFGQKTLSEAAVDWVLTDVRSGEAVYRATTEGGNEGPHADIGTVVNAVRESFRRLLADEGFIAKLRL